MAGVVPAELDARIGRVFGENLTASLNPTIRASLAQFWSEYPRDDQILVHLEPGTGYGCITCMEDSCYEDIRLTASSSTLDGGKTRGFGDLSAYRDHIDLSVSHRTARDRRVGVQAESPAPRPSPSTSRSSTKPLNASSSFNRDVKPNLMATPTPKPKLEPSEDRKPSMLELLSAVDPNGRKAKPAAVGSKGKEKEKEDRKPVFGSGGHKRSSSGGFDGLDEKKIKWQHPNPNQARAPAHQQPQPQPHPLFQLQPKPQLQPQPQAPPYQLQPHQPHQYFAAPAPLRAAAPAIVPAPAPAPAAPVHLPGRHPQPPGYDTYIAQIRARINLYNARVVGLRAIPDAAKTPEHWKQFDEAMRMEAQDRTLLGRYLEAYGEPVVANAPAPVAGPSGLQRGLAALGGIGGKIMDAVEGVNRMIGMDDDEDDLWRAVNGGLPTNEDLEDFLRRAAEGSDFEGNATVDESAKALGLKDQKQCIEGMLVHLLAHQLIGVHWMVKQEESKHYGGIMGDEMGLGKTVQTIALMCKNSSNDPKEKTSLIVAPLALLDQWKEEILSKTTDKHFKVLIYHGEGRKAVRTVKQLLSFDVVLTTYHTLAGEWPDDEEPKKKKKKDNFVVDDDDDVADWVKKQAGILFKASWFRIVLDEAQNIRNRKTKISRSVAQLDSLYRWCLTGTPVTNSLGDIFPLLRFLQIKPWFDWKEYQSHVVINEKKNPKLAGQRAQAILGTCLMRRKKTSQLDGKDLVTLPTKTVELHALEFSKEERDIYSFVEGKSQQIFNKFLKAGTVMKNYASVLVLLLRLRQLCLHPALTVDGFEALQTDIVDEKKKLEDLEEAEKIMGEAKVAKVRKARLAHAVEMVRAEREDAEAEFEDEECPICMDSLANAEGGAVVTACMHLFCKPCLDDVLASPAADGDDDDDIHYAYNQRPCPNCRAPFSESTYFPLSAFEPSQEEITKEVGVAGEDIDLENSDGEDDKDELEEKSEDEEEDLPVVSRGPKQKNRARVIDSDDEDEAKEEADKKDQEKAEKKKAKMKELELPDWMASQEPSTKMRWLLEEIQRLESEAPDDKILVISSFVSALDIVEDYLQSNGIRVTRYQGDMNASERSESVRILTKSKKCKIMLMSLKCGGVGLNLVRANHVISLDLAWSHAVESQAFDRVHRIGQVKEVKVDRLTIANTVEQRIGELQDRKKQLADASLGEGDGQKLGKLSVADLAHLFGLRADGRRI
ncbi:hypothetical protein MNV49_006525 [Pseudohyphozyma bogoriensis]|nr:hypothetical protein MNV49_006525 [Pseudohyphozyma bogoriensis]